MHCGSPGVLSDPRRAGALRLLAAIRPAAAPAPHELYASPALGHLAEITTSTRAMVASSAVLVCTSSSAGGGAGAVCGSNPGSPPRRPIATGCAPVSNSSHSQPSSRVVTCQGYVGQGARPAGEYHECDFDWQEHAATVQHLVEAQQAQALALRLEARKQEAHPRDGAEADRSDGQRAKAAALGVCAHHTPSQQLQREKGSPITMPGTSDRSDGVEHGSAELKDVLICSISGPTKTVPAAVAATKAAAVGRSGMRASRATAGCASAGPPASRPATSAALNDGNGGGGVYEGGRWEEFYRSHLSVRFFKERRYLLLEFPDLLRCGHVAEIGCGCGSSILPVLKANSAARTTCTDISETCLHQLCDAAAAEGIDASRVSTFAADATNPAAGAAFERLDADALLIMFTLSAVTPPQQLEMLRHAWRALRPGGRLMLRDHGLYDMVQLRIPADQWVGPNLYKRGDGTMAYFFSTEELRSRAMCAGFETVECKYVTVVNRNRKTGVELRRVFVHGVFEKPGAPFLDVFNEQSA